MQKKDYYAEMLKNLKEELEHETILIDGLKKTRNKLEREGWKPLDPIKTVIGDLKKKRSSLEADIEKMEEVMRTKK
jgi:hypothetical protein